MESITGQFEVTMTETELQGLTQAIAHMTKFSLQFDLVTELTAEQEDRLTDWLKRIGGWRVGNRIGIPTKLLNL